MSRAYGGQLKNIMSCAEALWFDAPDDTLNFDLCVEIAKTTVKVSGYQNWGMIMALKKLFARHIPNFDTNRFLEEMEK